MIPKDPEKFVEVLLKDKKLKLQHLHEQHREAIAVYEAKKEMFQTDIDTIEKTMDYYDKK